MKLEQIIRILLVCHSANPPPSITGKTGKTQGANIVNMPAKKEAIYNPIC